MDKKNRIVIIGGTACGPKAAARARRCDPQAEITLVEQGNQISTTTCGLPYYVSGVIDSNNNMVAIQMDRFMDITNVDVRIRTEATAIDRKAHKVETRNVKSERVSSIEYDKLVLATGSVPAVPNLEGKQLSGIFTLTTKEDAIAIRNLVSPGKIKNTVIIGAGLIGLEMAEAFASVGIEVTMVEALGWVLPTLLDFEIAAHVEKHMATRGIKFLPQQRVTGFEGDDNGMVRRVITEDAKLEASLVLMAIGARPNSILAQNAGLTIGSTRGIAVNEYLQTSDPNIYAGGDCVENINRITGQKMLAPMGSTANKHGRVIGTNVTGGHESFPGVLGTTIAKVFDYNVGRVGLSELQARDAGYEVITCLAPGGEHAGFYPGGKEILVKLISEKSSNRILGGQIVGPGDSAKRIDVLATALSFGATIDDLANFDLAYAPPYNSAMDRLHDAANILKNKRSGLAKTITPMEVKSKLDRGDDFILLDVRSPEEWETCLIEAEQIRKIELRELWAQMEGIPKNTEIVTTCKFGMRAYHAQRILEGAGFKNVKFMDGSISSWPYEMYGEKPF